MALEYIYDKGIYKTTSRLNAPIKVLQTSANKIKQFEWPKIVVLSLARYPKVTSQTLEVLCSACSTAGFIYLFVCLLLHAQIMSIVIVYASNINQEPISLTPHRVLLRSQTAVVCLYMREVLTQLLNTIGISKYAYTK